MLTKVYVDSGVIVAKTPFELKEICRSIPGRRWNKARRRWEFPFTPTAAQTVIEKFEPFTELIDNEIYEMALLAVQRKEMRETSNLKEIKSKIKPWEHQLRAYWFAKDQTATMLAMDMGTGKSKVIVDLIDNDISIQKVLIICPVSVLNVWDREFRKHSISDIKPLILYYDKISKRLETAQSYIKVNDVRKKRSVLVINYEAVWRQPFAKWCLESEWDLIVFDEVHKLKAPGGVASRFCSRLADRARQRIGLTGTPMPHSPLDVYGQFRALDKGIYGTSFTSFRAQYAEMGGFHQKQVVRFKNQDDLRRRFDKIAFQVRKEDVLDLPPSIDTIQDFYLDEATVKIYDSLEKQFWAEVDQGIITASNALVKLLRLQQLTSGFLKLDDSEDILQVSTSKQDALKDVIEGIDTGRAKLVIFTRFVNDLDIVERIAHDFKLEYGEVSGRRKDLTGEASYPDDVNILGVQIQAGGLGIDLSAASYAIYYSMGFSLGDYEQSKARIHRPGQTKPVTNIHLLARNTVDFSVFYALKTRGDIINSILKMKGVQANGRTQIEQADLVLQGS